MKLIEMKVIKKIYENNYAENKLDDLKIIKRG